MDFLSLKPFCLICVLLALSTVHASTKDVLPVPQKVILSPDLSTQQLSISWDGGALTEFDLLIVRTELNDTVFYETVSVGPDKASGQHRFIWKSQEPLECTSLSVRIRSRIGPDTSDWSITQILQGNDVPSNEKMQVYPQDKILPAGANVTFCCIVGEGKVFRSFHYMSSAVNVTRLSRRTYSTTVYDQKPSPPSGTNAYCRGPGPADITGAVVFVAYPPLLTDFVCETDLSSVTCLWTEARNTHLYGKRQTRYTINGRNCSVVTVDPSRKRCHVERWEEEWKLEGTNALGQYSLTDSADARSRVVPQPPQGLSSLPTARNASVTWHWNHSLYSSLPLVCQVELTTSADKIKRTFSGVGLRSVVLLDLYPFEENSIKVRCGAQQNFWKWGNWSKTISFKTDSEVADPPDVWVWMNSDNTGRLLWKPYEPRQSHGPIMSYEVTVWSSDENSRHTQNISGNTFTIPLNLSDVHIGNTSKVVTSVTAKNPAGLSSPASVLLPLHVTDVDSQAVTKVDFREGSFPLSWSSDLNSSCGFVVEWREALCVHNCSVDWLKVRDGINNVSVKSDSFEPGVRYFFSLYGCSSEATELLQRWHGFTRELTPSSSVRLSTSQQDADVLITWREIPSAHRRGFLLGYNVYVNNGSQLTHLATLSSQETSYTVKGLPLGSYKFTVKAYTSAGEDTGETTAITLEPYADWLVMEILASLGVTALFLIIVTFICYKKRKWVKGAFNPYIPQPKLPGDWSRPQGTLDIKPSPHSMVHIVDQPEWDSSKEALVVIPEEDEDVDGQGIGDEPVDTDEPSSLRYYNQVVDERPIRPRYPDSSASSASSLDSARTDVTYTGIQTSGSSLVFQSDSQTLTLEAPSAGGSDGGGYRPQMQPAQAPPQSSQEDSGTSGYRPQNSWTLDSPGEADDRRSLAPSLGSPTSIASTQFLLPDGESEEQAGEKHPNSAATWFTNLLSSTKP